MIILILAIWWMFAISRHTTSLSPDMFFLLFPYFQFIGDSLTLVFLKKFILKHASFQQKKSQFLAVCSLNVFYVWMSCSKKNKIQFPDIVKTHPHTHRNPYSLSHTHTLLHTVENLLEKKKMCFPFFFCSKWRILIWYSLWFLFIRCGCCLNEVMFVTPLTNPVTLFFLISAAKWTSISISTFHFLLNVRVCEFVYFVIWFRHCKEKFKK